MTLEVRSLADMGPAARSALFERDAGIASIRGEVEAIVDRVRDEGDAALRAYAEEHDDVTMGNLDITDTCEEAYETLDPPLREAIDTAIENVASFHESHQPADWREEFTPGRILGRQYRPLDRVGVYVPGGTAAYPSSAIMGVVPADVAGVDHVVVITPPADDPNPATLAALYAAGADHVFQSGGAQGIAALAYGTESIPAVQKIVGPGNRWVTGAKAVVQGDVSIDFLAGPSEIIVIADETADPELVAADLVAQAEHDERAACLAVTDDAETAEAIVAELSSQLPDRSRESIIRAALEHPGSGVVLTRSLTEAITFTNEYAPEHLSIVTADEAAVLDRISAAGSIFLGHSTPVAAGDYASGTNHVLPTTGEAKRTGGLSVETFMRSSTVQRLDGDALTTLAETITTLADTEGLEAHAESIRRRFDSE